MVIQSCRICLASHPNPISRSQVIKAVWISKAVPNFISVCARCDATHHPHGGPAPPHDAACLPRDVPCRHRDGGIFRDDGPGRLRRNCMTPCPIRVGGRLFGHVCRGDLCRRCGDVIYQHPHCDVIWNLRGDEIGRRRSDGSDRRLSSRMTLRPNLSCFCLSPGDVVHPRSSGHQGALQCDRRRQ